MRLFEIDTSTDDLVDMVSALILSAKESGLSEIKPAQLLADLRLSGVDISVQQLLGLLQDQELVRDATPASIRLDTAGTTRITNRPDQEAEHVKGMASRHLQRALS